MTSSSLPVGYRFHPTEEELIDHFLKKKINGQRTFDDDIPEIDICSIEPWDLPDYSLIKSDDEWFYFSRVGYKSKGNSRKRATERGFWKITGKEREIRARGSKDCIGKKRILTFHIGKVRSSEKTGWVIHEYYIPEDLFPKAARQRDFVLCRLKKKDESTETGLCDEGEVFQSRNNVSDFQNLRAILGSPIIQEDLQITLQDTWPEEDDYLLEDERPTTFFNQSHEPTSVYEQGMDQQGLSIQDTNALPLNQLLQKQTSFVNVASNLSPNISRVKSVNVKEPKYKPTYTLQAGGSDEVFACLFTGTSSRTETRLEGEILNYGAEAQSKPLTSMPLHPRARPYPNRPGHFYMVRNLKTAAQKSKFSFEALSKLTHFDLISLDTIKPPEEPKPMAAPEKPKPMAAPVKPKPMAAPEKPKPMAAPEKPKEPEWPKPMEDKQEIMRRKQTNTTAGDWKSSFIVWKESPLSLALCPPAVYIRNMIGGLVLSMFFVGELVSFGKW